jgi:hypothetical protein
MVNQVIYALQPNIHSLVTPAVSLIDLCKELDSVSFIIRSQGVTTEFLACMIDSMHSANAGFTILKKRPSAIQRNIDFEIYRTHFEFHSMQLLCYRG